MTDKPLPGASGIKKGAGCVTLFVKSPDHAAVKSRLAPALGDLTARELYRNFVLDILDTLSEVAGKGSCELLVYVYPPRAMGRVGDWLGCRYKCAPQRGNDLGERMKNAFRESFARGCTRAVIIGSDAPDLTAGAVEEALDRLQTCGAVIGPAHDGGYYLIGFQSRAFLPAAFEDIPWSTEGVFTCTTEILRKAGCEVSVLPPWRDVDTREDLRALEERHGGQSWFANSRTMRFLRSGKG